MNSNKDRRNRLLVFSYHAIVRTPLDVSDWCFLDLQVFKKQISFINRHFKIVSLSEGIERVQDKSKHPLMAAITFDDGFKNVYDFAYPFLRKNQIPASIFVSTSFVDSDETIWFCKLNHALAKSKKTAFEWKGRKYNLSQPIQKARTSKELQRELKKLPQTVLLSELDNITHDLTGTFEQPLEADSPYRIISSDEMIDMYSSGIVEFGAHTHTHAILSLLNPDEQAIEIKKSVDTVSSIIGRDCRYFAYPNGKKWDYNVTTLKILRDNNIEKCLSTQPGTITNKTSDMDLFRYECGLKGSKMLWSVYLNSYLPFPIPVLN